MSEDRTATLPVGADLGQWAAGEVQKHEEICGLRYEAIGKDMQAIRDRCKAIEDKISGAVKWVLGIVASLAVALIMMMINNAQATRTADEADKRELRARLSLLTTQLQNVQPHGPVVVAPPGTQVTAVPDATAAPVPLDQDDLAAAAGGKPSK